MGLLPEEVEKPSAEVMAALNINPAVFMTEGGREMSRIVFSAMMGENRKVAVLKLQYGKFEKGEWIPARTLNGDEQMMISFSDVPSCLYVELYKY